MPFSMCEIQYVQEFQLPLVPNLLFDWNDHWFHIYRTPLLLYKIGHFLWIVKVISNSFSKVSHATTIMRCRVDSRNHLSNTWMPIIDNAQIISIIYKASHILKKYSYEASYSLSTTQKATGNIGFSISCATPIAKLLHTCSLEMCHQRLLLFSFLENQLSKQHMIQRSTGTSLFHWAIMLSFFLNSLKYIPVLVKHYTRPHVFP